ncbi:DNA polymerase III subunit delta [Prolixibacteraceae bacterium Z1-6]|uniref:DNA polymerase III subunit delta n=1 Tax=Draconibacterium aestuarii TaxID=2998507 RepID=A0A9X3J5M1_9BACT|nr:DNA polymerase III subunit delta [Prolixibacteraceae bacterium Z1-6]
MEFGDILQNLKKGIYHPIYLLQGEEPYFIDELSNYIEKNVLTDAEKGFNQTIFYGKDSDALTIAESSMRFPMMASKQVIIVKEAQSLAKIDTLTSYAERPLESTILVLDYKYKNLDSRTKLVKAIKKNGVVFTSKKLYENKIPGWIDVYLKNHDYTITPQAALLLTSYLGTDLSKIANELNKLVIAVKESTKITPEHIEKNIGLSKDFNVLELQNALGDKNVLKANKIINYFGANPTLNPIQKTIAGLYFYFSKLFTYHFLTDKSERNVAAELRVHPFFVREYVAAAKKYSPTKLYEIMGILREYDMKSKGFNVSTMVETGDLQKEMIYKILH